MIPVPTVVLDQSCAVLEKDISGLAPTFVFERSGGFLIEPRAAAAEMFARLNSRGIPAPYLLVGASYAAFTQLIFASQWRDAVVGMILLDPSHPRQGEKALATLSKHQVGASESIERFRTMLRGFGPAWEDGCRQVSAVDCLGSMPLTVIAAGAPEMPDELAPEVRAELIGDRHNLLTEYCKLTERGEMRIAEGIGHDIARLAPELALDSVRRMLALVGPAKKK